MSQDMAVAEASELRLLLAQRRSQRRQQQQQQQQEDVLMQHRSESAPPTVEGSLGALGLADAAEAELRSDPAYLAYYQSHVNLNPRLPPPVKSWENWRLAQRLQLARSTFGLDDDDSSSSGSGRSLFSSQPPLPTHREDAEAEVAESLEHLLLRRQQQPTTIVQQQQEGESNAAPRPTNKSLVDLIQEDFPRTPSPVYNHSRPSSRAAVAAAANSSSEDGFVDTLLARARSTTPKPASAPVIATASPGLADLSTSTADLAAALKMLDVRHEEAGVDVRRRAQQEHQLHQQQQQQRQQHRHHYPHHHPLQPSAFAQQQQQQQQQAKLPPSAHNMYAAAAAAAMSYIAAGNPYYHGSYPTPYGYSPSMLPPPMNMMPGYPAPPMAAEHFHKLTGHLPNTLQDAFYLQYLRASDDAARTLAEIRNSYTAAGDEVGGVYGHEHKQQQHFPARSGAVGMPVPCVKTATSAAPAFYGSPPGFVLPFPSSPLAGSPVLPSSPVAPLRRDERGPRMPPAAPVVSRLPVPMGSYAGSYNGEEMRGSFLLEEFKSNKARRFELPDIAGHIVEFSADQHGSRFIQQKLESATAEEKSMVFQEVLPHAVALMTDVFGNYVIQKFFEHGNQIQRKELARQLVGRVLTLSLQMYGCRVIQKALEVIDVDQQAQLVSELDGHVMRCVRDQNGNHVIQKCIECVPSDRIQFIISAFHGQVVALSTHPYGCRVIQRVLEHCSQEQKQKGIIDEIVRSTCSLAQDQYGNYVVQHVLEHGSQEDRTDIITRLAGQIVQMSQHKFASNVIERCLQFASPAQRQIIINEMLGQTQENEALQAMMKDQFANYVVQKVLEICDDEQREFLLARIKVHLHALKKYTYGKHIVARVEKLVAAGERRSAAVAAAAGAQSTT